MSVGKVRGGRGSSGVRRSSGPRGGGGAQQKPAQSAQQVQKTQRPDSVSLHGRQSSANAANGAKAPKPAQAAPQDMNAVRASDAGGSAKKTDNSSLRVPYGPQGLQPGQRVSAVRAAPKPAGVGGLQGSGGAK